MMINIKGEMGRENQEHGGGENRQGKIRRERETVDSITKKFHLNL